jgi:hypothetical protein
MVSTYIGDAIWVIALTIMFSASTQASNRTAGDSHLPVLGANLPRTLALWALPGGAFAISLWFAYTARTNDLSADAALILLGVRALSASLLALLHLRLLSGIVRPPGSNGS